MKISFRYLLILMLFCLSHFVIAQKEIPVNYFGSPLDINLSITGSFAEIRGNHFHSGIDFAVQQKEGLPVYAVADGLVSRVKVSPIGFGNALYIDHPNGFTSVYAHLYKFNDTISQYVLTAQYKAKSFDVDLFPAGKKDFIYVKKGQLIGYAGNSGSSGGAHLHFEIRNTITENIINPLLFGLSLTDNFSPYIDFIKIYPDDRNSYIGDKNEALKFNVKKTGRNEYKLAIADTLKMWGNFSIGVQAFDFNQSQSNRNGFYKVMMSKDEQEFFSMQCDSFAFAESRYVNASIDFPSNYNLGNRIVKSKKLSGNKLSFFDTKGSNGVINFIDGDLHTVAISVADQAGNRIDLTFIVKSEKPGGIVQVPALIESDTSVLIRFDKQGQFENKDIKVEFPTGSLYSDQAFLYSKKPQTKGLFSDIHYLHTPEEPIHNRIKVSIRARNLPASLQNKALLVRIDRDGKRSSAGGGYESGFVTAATNLFDGYAIGIDTIAPSIKPSAENVKSKTMLKFTVSDNFSGITKYRGELNGKWVLVEWDPKNKRMQYRFDFMVQEGSNTFVLYLEDAKGNKSQSAITFVK